MKTTKLSNTKKYHYVYRITNLVTKMHYYGDRSCNCHPSEDLGIKYFSSFTNKFFKVDQLNNVNNYKYKIIKIFETCREDAKALEIKLHTKFDVKNNIDFINRANQSSIGFDTTGIDYRNGKVLAVYDLIENRNTFITYNEFDVSRYKFNAKGKRTVIEIKTGKTKQIDIDKFNDYDFKHVTSNKLAALNTTTGEINHITTEEFYSNNIYQSIFKNTLIVYDNKLSKNIRIPISEFEKNNLRYSSPLKNRITIYDKITKTYKSVSLDEFESNDNYVNRNAKIIKIYDSSDNLMFECFGDFKKVCTINNLPTAALTNSFRSMGKQLYMNNYGLSRAKRFGYAHFKGWYAVMESK